MEVAVLGSLSLISMVVSVDVRQHRNEKQAGHLPRYQIVDDVEDSDRLTRT